jgi:hypothetical protein
MAAKWNGISFDQFVEKEGVEQSRLVAAFETALQIDAVVARDAIRKGNRKNKRGNH